MNGVGLTAVGRLLGHSKRETTAIYAHLDDGALQEAAAQAAAVIARAMGYKPDASFAPEASAENGSAEQSDGVDAANRSTERADPHHPNASASQRKSRAGVNKQESAKSHPKTPESDWLAAHKFGIDSESRRDTTENSPSRSRDVDWL